MTKAEQRVLDEIDELVDAQLAQEASGDDNHINQPECRICGEDRHTLPITARMREMRRKFRSTIAYYETDPRVSRELVAELDAYRYNEDDSPIVCPGSDFVGPLLPSYAGNRSGRLPVRPWLVFRRWLDGDPPLTVAVTDVDMREHLYLAGTMLYAQAEDGAWPIGRISRVYSRRWGSWYIEYIPERAAPPSPRGLYVTDREETRREVEHRQAQNLRAIEAIRPLGVVRAGNAQLPVRVMAEDMHRLSERVRDIMRALQDMIAPAAADAVDQFLDTARRSNTPPMWTVNPGRERRRRRT